MLERAGALPNNHQAILDEIENNQKFHKGNMAQATSDKKALPSAIKKEHNRGEKKRVRFQLSLEQIEAEQIKNKEISGHHASHSQGSNMYAEAKPKTVNLENFVEPRHQQKSKQLLV